MRRNASGSPIRENHEVVRASHGDAALGNAARDQRARGDLPVRRGDLPVRRGDLPVRRGDLPVRRDPSDGDTAGATTPRSPPPGRA
jgi:hypothetical protein